MTDIYSFIPFTQYTVLPKTDDNQFIDVYLIKAPLLDVSNIISGTTGTIPDILNNVPVVNVYQSGIAFVYRQIDNEFLFTYNLLPGNSFLNTLIPTILNGTLIWNNQARVTFSSPIDRSLWTISTYICTCIGTQFNQITQFMLDYQGNNPMYVASDVENTNGSLVLKGASCDIFCQNVISYVQEINCKVSTNTIPLLNKFTMYTGLTNGAVPIDPIFYHQIILDYYEGLIFVIQTVLIDLNLLEEGQIPSDAIIIMNLEAIVLAIAEYITGFAIIYAYDASNVPTYYQVFDTTLYIAYSQITLLNNVNIVNYLSQVVDSNYVSVNPGVNFLNENNSHPNSYLYWLFYSVTIIILIIIIILLWLSLSK